MYRYVISIVALAMLATVPATAAGLSVSLAFDEWGNFSTSPAWVSVTPSIIAAPCLDPQNTGPDCPTTGPLAFGYLLSVPFTTAGDVLVQDPASFGSCPPTTGNCFSDLLRFENIDFGNNLVFGAIFVYSDAPENGETNPPPADLGPPPTSNPTVTLTEQGDENFNWVVHNPSSTDPGYVSTDFNATYTFISDGSVPEPGTLVCCWVVGWLF